MRELIRKERHYEEFSYKNTYVTKNERDFALKLIHERVKTDKINGTILNLLLLNFKILKALAIRLLLRKYSSDLLQVDQKSSPNDGES
jgi:hypothetical protein